MENLPFYISGEFIATTLLTMFLLYRAGRYNKMILIFSIGWLLLQGGLTLTDFYQVRGGVPPRFSLLLIPPVLLIAGLFATKRGGAFLDSFNTQQLTLLHIVRLPVELTLWALYLYHFIPGRMTFEGGNLDILSGMSAPLIYYWGYIKPAIQRKWLLVWNIACLLLLVNIVSRAVLSFGQPNLALFYFPYSWLPGFVVPSVLLAHLITIRRLVQKID